MPISIVVPVYNEIEVLPTLLQALRLELSGLGEAFEVLFVDDASSDGSSEWLTQQARLDASVKVLTLSRNFGHQAAITVGLDFANGDAVIVMDADMQDPPSLIPEMVHWYRQGFHVVSAQRAGRDGDSGFKRRSAGIFYWVMRRMIDQRLQPEVGDFRLFSREAVLALREFREQHRFMRGLVAWLGLNEAIVRYDRPAREAGTSKYPLSKMLKFAWTGISSFSALPLRLSLGFGLGLTAMGFLYSAYAIYQAVVRHDTVQGWTSLVCLQIVFSGAILIGIGLLGDYLGKVFDESKRRPLYVVSAVENVALPVSGVPRGLVLARSHSHTANGTALAGVRTKTHSNGNGS